MCGGHFLAVSSLKSRLNFSLFPYLFHSFFSPLSDSCHLPLPSGPIRQAPPNTPGCCTLSPHCQASGSPLLNETARPGGSGTSWETLFSQASTAVLLSWICFCFSHHSFSVFLFFSKAQALAVCSLIIFPA